MRRAGLLALLPLVLAACGGSGGTTPPQQADTSAAAAKARSAYIAKADAACARFQGNHPEIGRSIAKLKGLTIESPNALEILATHYELVRDVVTEFKAEFTKIEPPEADRERIDELNKLNDEALALLSEAIPELRAGRNPNDLFVDYGGKVAAANQLAAAYGFEVCSRNSAGQR